LVYQKSCQKKKPLIIPLQQYPRIGKPEKREETPVWEVLCMAKTIPAKTHTSLNPLTVIIGENIEDTTS